MMSLVTGKSLDQSVSLLPPIFIVGAQRSGTTMLRLMLNAHPKIAIPFESGFIPKFYYSQGDYGDLKDKDNAMRMLRDVSQEALAKKGRLIENMDKILSYPISSYADLVRAIFMEHARNVGKKRWGDKTPSYVTELDVLWRLFPGCHIVHLVRDGRDVALSLKGLDWGSRNIPQIAQSWRWKTTLAHKIGTILGPEHYLEVRYEDLVLETERTLRRICEFVGEDYHDSMLDYHETAVSEMPQESIKYHTTSIRPPERNKVMLWKRRMSAADRVIFEQNAGSTLDLFGYEIEGRASTLGSRLKNLLYCMIA